jgi:hypothetical protein
MKLSMVCIFTFSAALTILAGQPALASLNACQNAAIKSAYAQFKLDSRWSEQEMNKASYVDNAKGVYHENGDAPGLLTVDISSTDSRDWDGYAQYKVLTQPAGSSCQVGRVVLSGSEGI